MLTAVVVLFALSLVAELAGFAVIVRNVVASRNALRDWTAMNPKGYRAGTYDQIENLNGVVMDFMGAPRRNVLAAGLVGAGLVTGAAANFLSLAI